MLNSMDTISAHSLGVKLEPEATGIFDDWHREDVGRLTQEITVLRSLARDDHQERIELRSSVAAWRLAAVFTAGLFVVAIFGIGGK